MRPFLPLLLLCVLVTSCAGIRRDEGGQIVVAGTVTSGELRIGDCFQDWDADSSQQVARVRHLAAVPCSEPHDNEVFHVGAYATSASLAWPGEAHLTSYAAAVCLGAFAPFVGRDNAASRLDYGYIRPTKESWELRDERRIVCFLFDSSGAPLTGSMRRSGQ